MEGIIGRRVLSHLLHAYLIEARVVLYHLVPIYIYNYKLKLHDIFASDTSSVKDTFSRVFFKNTDTILIKKHLFL